MIRRILKGMGVAAAVVAGLGLSGAGASAGVVYGISDTGQILSVDLATHVESELLAGLGSDANGLAFDTVGGRLLFRTPSTGELRAFNVNTNSLSTINILELAGTNASSAAFYDGAYWFVNQATDDLIKVDLTSSTPVVSTFLNFDGNVHSSFSFGDIVIDNNGILYGSSNRGFFSVDISGASPTSFNLINTSTEQLQLAFRGDGVLLGQKHGGSNAGQWYTINLTSGIASEIEGFKTTQFRDLTSAAVPEPTSIAMLGLGGMSILGLARRRLKKAA